MITFVTKNHKTYEESLNNPLDAPKHQTHFKKEIIGSVCQYLIGKCSIKRILSDIKREIIGVAKIIKRCELLNKFKIGCLLINFLKILVYSPSL
jgi:hypothetical protein